MGYDQMSLYGMNEGLGPLMTLRNRDPKKKKFHIILNVLYIGRHNQSIFIENELCNVHSK